MAKQSAATKKDAATAQVVPAEAVQTASEVTQEQPTEKAAQAVPAAQAAQETPGAEAAKEGDAVDALWIRSVPESFRRCGYRFTREGFGIALDLLTDEQVETLESEPNLVVERCSVAAKDPAE